MSTTFNKILPAGSFKYSKYVPMDGKRLAALVKRLRADAGLTLAQVETNSGGGITNGYISKIENAHDISITLEKLFALAKGLKVSPDVLYKAVKGETPADSPAVEHALGVLREMSEREQVAAVRVLQAMSGAHTDLANGPIMADVPHVKVNVRNTKNVKDDKKKDAA